MPDYPYEAIAAAFKAMANGQPKTADEIKIERKPVRVWNKTKSQPLPKRVPGEAWERGNIHMSPEEIKMCKRAVKLHYVWAPWVEGLHFDSRV